MNAIGHAAAVFCRNQPVGRLSKPTHPRRADFEEILRLESPVIGFFRVARHDVAFGEDVVPEGAKVLLHFAAANRDPNKYPDPDVFDIDRNPLDHVAFGYGMHACAGQGLARMELHTAPRHSRPDRHFELAGGTCPRSHQIVRGTTLYRCG